MFLWKLQLLVTYNFPSFFAWNKQKWAELVNWWLFKSMENGCKKNGNEEMFIFWFCSQFCFHFLTWTSLKTNLVGMTVLKFWFFAIFVAGLATSNIFNSIFMCFEIRCFNCMVIESFHATNFYFGFLWY